MRAGNVLSTKCKRWGHLKLQARVAAGRPCGVPALLPVAAYQMAQHGEFRMMTVAVHAATADKLRGCRKLHETAMNVSQRGLAVQAALHALTAALTPLT